SWAPRRSRGTSSTSSTGMSRWATSLTRRWRLLRSSSIASSGPRPWDANSPDPYGSVRAREGRTSSSLTREPITLIAGAEIVARAIDRIPRHRGRLHPSDRGILGPRRREWTAPRAWGHLDLSHEHKPRDGTLPGRARRPDGDRARSDRGGRADVRCLCDVRQWERKRHRDIRDPVRIHAGLGRMDRQRPRNTRRTRTEDAFFRHRSRGERNHPHEPDPIALCAQRPEHNVVSTQWRRLAIPAHGRRDGLSVQSDELLGGFPARLLRSQPDPDARGRPRLVQHDV